MCVIIWKSWAPGKCKLFMWLVAHNKCWTDDWLCQEGFASPWTMSLLWPRGGDYKSPAAVLCLFMPDMVQCFTRTQLAGISSTTWKGSFGDWWNKVSSRVDGQVKQGLNLIIILVAWSLWNHCVFDGLQPNLNGILSSIREDLHMWDIAGAWGIAYLLALLPDG